MHKNKKARKKKQEKGKIMINGARSNERLFVFALRGEHPEKGILYLRYSKKISPYFQIQFDLKEIEGGGFAMYIVQINFDQLK